MKSWIEKVKKYFKSVGLENIFESFLWEKKKVHEFLTFFFYIFHESAIKNFIKWFINKRLKSALLA